MLKLLYFLIFLLLAAAVFLFLRLDVSFTSYIQRVTSRKAKVSGLKVRHGGLLKKLEKLERKRRSLLEQSSIPRKLYYVLTALCIIVGVVVGKTFFQSGIIAVAVGVMGALCPLLYLSYKLTAAKSADLDKLSGSMMILSNAYVVNEDFLASVRDNVDSLEYPAPFRDFLTYVTYMDASVQTGLRRMEAQVANSFFSQWVDALVMAQEDRALKYVTVSIVDAMHDMQQAQAEADAAMYAVWREYITVLILIFSVPLIFKLLMPDAYMSLASSAIGQGLFVLLLVAVAFSLVRAVKLNKPLMV